MTPISLPADHNRQKGFQMLRRVLLMTAMAGLAGCASTKDTNLASGGAGPHAGQVVGYTGSHADGFMAMSPAKAAFGGLGALAMVETGKRIAKETGIEDPASELAHNLAAELAAAGGAQLAAAPAPVAHGGLLIPSPAKLSAAAAGAQYLVDVETQNWGFAYYATDWGHYHVNYWARVRLVDASTKAIAAEHLCKWDSDKTRPRLTTDELLNDHANGLKQLFAQGAGACADEFRGVLGLPVRTAAAGTQG